MNRRRKEETSTSRVLRTLCQADDFRTSRQLQDETGLDVNHVSAALHHLRKHQAVDLVEAEDNLWWFATPTTDTRCRVVEERTPELNPRRPRRRRTTNIAH